MRSRSLLVALAAAGGVAALVHRRKAAAARVAVFYEDGSMLSLEQGTPQAERMLAVALAALRTARAA
jgi:hypothetical protein